MFHFRFTYITARHPCWASCCGKCTHFW